jgi:uncharacterized membrane protein
MKNEKTFPFAVLSRTNYLLIIIGLLLIVIGFMCMSGGGTKDPNVFAGDTLFSFRRLTLSTILILLGFAFEIVGVLFRPKENK